MADRSELIAQKQSLLAEMAQVRREIAREQSRPQPRASRLRTLESQLDRLMAEEHNLRQQIDRSA